MTNFQRNATNLNTWKPHDKFPVERHRGHWQSQGTCLKHEPSQLRTQRGPNRSQQKQSTYTFVALGSLSASADAIHLHLCLLSLVQAAYYVRLHLCCVRATIGSNRRTFVFAWDCRGIVISAGRSCVCDAQHWVPSARRCLLCCDLD